MSRWSARALVVLVTALLGIALTAVAAWGVDKMLHADQVNRNVLLAGVPVGGLNASELDPILDNLAAETASDPVTIRAVGFGFTAKNADAGITIDRDAVIAAVLDAGRDTNPIDDFSAWMTALRSPAEIDLVYQVDLDVARDMIRSAPGWVRIAPIEPSFTASSGEFVVTPGKDGEYLDPDLVAEALAAEVVFGTPSFSVDVAWSPLAPRLDEAHVEAAIASATDLAAKGLLVRVNSDTAYVRKAIITQWIDSELGADGLTPVFNEERVLESLEPLLAGYASDFPQPVYHVVDGELTFALDGDPAMTCCDTAAADDLYRVAVSGENNYVVLPTRPAEVDGGVARIEGLGIVELVGEFTTNHACCQNRVDNIQRIADIIRGVVIEPGERFSVNDFVGERTREKGFVSAGTIQQGHFKDGVGGGISQFATTMFNAAFFAGLDFDDYRSHTIYISRYPYGREATLNYPDVDLAVVNNSPYSIFIWTDYTDTSITVQMYSTQYWEVEQTGQSSWRSGACTSVETFRSRTDPEGNVLEDSVTARYRPAEGIDCAGNSIPKP